MIGCLSHDDVSGIEQSRLGQMGDRTATSVSAQDGIAKRCLVLQDISRAYATLDDDDKGRFSQIVIKARITMS